MNDQTNNDMAMAGGSLVRLLVMQALLLMLVSASLGWLGRADDIPSFAFGVLLMALNASVLSWVVVRATRLDAKTGQKLLYAAAVMRFVLVLLALLAASSLGLQLLLVAAGMLVAQAAFYVTGFRAAYVGARLNGGSHLG